LKAKSVFALLLLSATACAAEGLPNIDRLAAEGVRFDSAYAVSGVCSPTRAALLTGLLPSQTGVHVALQAQVDVDNWSVIEEYRNLPQTLKNAGYTTGLVGKYHLGEYQDPHITIVNLIGINL